MSLVPWRPFKDIEKWFEEDLPELWEWPEKWMPNVPNFPLMRTPRADMYESDGNVIAEFELPGVDPKNIDIEVKKDMIEVEAKAEQKKEEKKKGYYKKELNRGYYKRVLPLPVDVKEDKVQAEYENGVLKVTMPKVSAGKKEKKKVKIKVNTKKK
ncbi:Hsp20/alpha crystallin family protein [bacterium]|nr:Hsp20/alpha crystallin family protein [bacterium]